MARIPDHELERIKREIAVADIARSLGIELKAHGANLIGLCPFHDDHEPSFVVTPANNLWHCMGACQKGGTNIDLMMLARKLSFRQAALALQAHPALPGPAMPTPVPRQYSSGGRRASMHCLASIHPAAMGRRMGRK